MHVKIKHDDTCDVSRELSIITSQLAVVTNAQIQEVCVTRFDESESAIQASPKKKRVFALARVENFVCVTAFAIGFWKLFSGGSLGKYSNIGSGSFFLKSVSLYLL